MSTPYVYILAFRAGHATPLLRQRDHAWYQTQKLLIIALCVYSMWLLHIDTKALTFFLFFLGTEALLHTLLRCRIVVVAQPNNCCLPSSARVEGKVIHIQAIWSYSRPNILVWTGVRLQSQKACYNFLIKSCFQFSLQKGAKPTLKKSESLFHTERIALSYRANCSFIQSESLFHTERTALSYRANRSFIQSESLFHTERIAYVFKKVKIAISSFWSSRSFKKSNRSNLLFL